MGYRYGCRGARRGIRGYRGKSIDNAGLLTPGNIFDATAQAVA
jgi:hypothetical protein